MTTAQTLLKQGRRDEVWQKYCGYLEAKPGEQRPATTLQRHIHEALQRLDTDYKNIQDMLGVTALRLTLLPPGTFQAYFEDRQRAGADLAHLKPPHMRASDEIIDRLLQFR